MSTTIIRKHRQPDSQGTERPYIEFLCDQCGKSHSRPRKEMREEKNFCSPKCYYDSLGHGSIKLICSNPECGKSFDKKRSHLNGSKSGLYFCCRVCKDIGQRLESGLTQIHPDHYGTDKKVDHRAIAFTIYPPCCNRCGWKEYKPVLDTHHKDGNHNNNHPDNLEILCPTCHQKEHYLSKTGRWRFAL